jgi:hypothetical protein
MKVAGKVRDRCVAAQTLVPLPSIDVTDLVSDILAERAAVKKKLDRLLRMMTELDVSTIQKRCLLACIEHVCRSPAGTARGTHASAG